MTRTVLGAIVILLVLGVISLLAYGLWTVIAMFADAIRTRRSSRALYRSMHFSRDREDV